MLAADTLASYGSLARFKDVQRLNTVGEFTILGAGGEFSDFQVGRVDRHTYSLFLVRAFVFVQKKLCAKY